MSAEIEFLETWYHAQCNGFWEHAHGVTIETLDNPGWMVSVNLAETLLENCEMEPVRQENSDEDWLICSVERNRFRGQGDASKLAAILGVFRAWALATAPVSPAGKK